MTTLFFNKKDGILLKWYNTIGPEHERIEFCDPISIEYRKIKIVSKCFDFVGTSEIMVINNVRTIQTKEKSMDKIVYYDDDVSPRRLKKGFAHILSQKKYFDIGTFDPSEYGNSVTYYNPAYENNNILITTKFYEIDDQIPKIITGPINAILSIGAATPAYGLYFSLTGGLVTGIESIVSNVTRKRSLSREHTIEFRSDDINRPLLVGSYLCLPDVENGNEVKNIIDNYIIDDNILIREDDGVEYVGTYFILELCNNIREDLNDFDFAASNNELLKKINERDVTGLDKLAKVTTNSNDMKLIQKILKQYGKNDSDNVTEGETDPIITSMYRHLSGKNQQWFNKHFTHVVDSINK